MSMINKETRVQSTSRTCLDHIFLKTKCLVNTFLPIIFKTILTDHFSTLLQWDSQSEKEKYHQEQCFKMFTDNNKLKLELEKENWLDVYDCRDPNNAVDIFISKLQKVISECTRKIVVKKQNIKRNMWITAGLVNAINKKNQMYKKLQKCPNNTDLKNDFRTYRNIVSGKKQITISSKLIRTKTALIICGVALNLLKVVNQTQEEIKQIKLDNEIIRDRAK
ncbi:hypothetical protein NQ317_011582 [Molorchus minor]|uniref:Uncharacterized protein n=1 Tax=Molorchus minor TaxID=1323400 RepID=A0ABQ9JDQ6_9CUCU|nr:hypothetical protein NQ317_011582 [Molorchus minor]